jgi:hypothetical protein
MAGKKYQTRVAGQNVLVAATQVSAGAANAGDLVALGSDGKIDSSMVTGGSGPSTTPYVASEAIGAGKFVNIYSNAGTMNIRLADNSNARPAHGFVIAAVANAGTGSVYELDAVNTALTGLTPGSNYFLGTAGGAITPALDAATATTGSIDQKLGFAKSTSELKTDDYEYVVL